RAAALSDSPHEFSSRSLTIFRRQLESFERLATNDESSSPTKYREGARREFVRGIAQRRRSMPSALMRELRVVGLMPRSCAAPPLPEIFQSADSSAAMIFCRSSSANSLAVRM